MSNEDQEDIQEIKSLIREFILSQKGKSEAIRDFLSAVNETNVEISNKQDKLDFRIDKLEKELEHMSDILTGPDGGNGLRSLVRDHQRILYPAGAEGIDLATLRDEREKRIRAKLDRIYSIWPVIIGLFVLIEFIFLVVRGFGGT